jgi:outer membrane receptor protein involved in Fe transport
MRLNTVRSATARVLAVLALVACTAVSGAFAQGVTSASVRGHVLDEAGAPVDGALITATNVASGLKYQVRSRAGGQFNMENLGLGRYTFEGRAIGFRPGRVEGQRLTLGQVLDLELRLTAAPVELSAITVTQEAANPLISSARTGAGTSVSDSVILRLPTLNRNFTDFISNVPQVVGTSMGGLNNRFNNIQIDGAVNNDLFGLAASGTPGGQAGARPISVEAVREFQVLIAPFDVRQGGFTGGIVNVVTRSGTNQFRGSVFGYYTNQSLQASYTDSTGLLYKPTDFNRSQYGFTLSGPIIRDKLHFFTVVDFSRRATPYSTTGQISPDTTGGADSVAANGNGIRWNTAIRMDSIMQARYGYSVGSPVGPTIKNPDTNILFKLSGQLGTATHFDLSHNSVVASDVSLSHAPGTANNGYQLSNSGYQFLSKTNSTRLLMNTNFGGRFTNELILGYSSVRDKRVLPNNIPRIVVNGDRCYNLGYTDTTLTAESGTVNCRTILAGGAERSSMANFLNQDIFEVTDNLTFPMGQHLITLGTHNEFFKFDNMFLQNAYGTWWFRDNAALAAGTPYQYQAALLLRPNGGEAIFKVTQLGIYAQDRWTPTPRLTLTAGLRYDRPSLPSPSHNVRLDSIFYVARGGAAATFDSANAVGGINTSKLSLKGLFSPRAGFNYDLSGNGSSVLRGGVGVFTGRPAYVWISNAFGGTGLEQATLTCNGRNGTTKTDTVPTFTLDVSNIPQGCNPAGTASSLTPPIATVTYYEQNFRFPQTMSLALGLDHKLPWGVVGTFDFLYKRYLNNYYINDVNLRGPTALAAGEGYRTMYGTISSSGSATASKISPAFYQVLRHSNKNGDRATSFTVQLQKRFSNAMEFSAGYTWSHALDYISLGSSVALSNYQFTTLDGTLENRNLRTSTFDRTHRFVFSGAFTLPYQVNAGLRMTVQSGTPYGYVANADVNADGVSGNDLVYVPLYSTDITLANPNDWTRLNNYINSEPCLNRQRGHIMDRNSCRNPVQTFLDARLSKTFPTFGGQSIEISADIFNLPRLLGSLLDNNWGEVRSTSGYENNYLLNLTGWDAGSMRGKYSLNLPVRRQVSVSASRWNMQFGARYSF